MIRVTTIFIYYGLPFAILAGASAPSLTLAQGIHNKTTLYINGANIFVDGAVLNGGTLENSGHISFTGDWENSGKYQGQGVLEASGNAPQRITHAGQNVATLLVNGWGTKYVKGILNISQSLQLHHGIVEVSSQNSLRMKPAAVVSGGSPDSYIDGALTVEGTGYKFFPIGKNGTYAPIEFVDVTGDAPMFSLEVFENAPVISVEDVVVRNAFYWQRKDLRGTFGSSNVAIDYDRNWFQGDEIILLAGSDWEGEFRAIKELEHSTETDKVTTQVPVAAPILLIGEISERWTEADFYFSTALSPHAAHADNKAVRIFGQRLSNNGFHFQVFDRWGTPVFESNSLEEMSSNGWDGRSQGGSFLATGVYPFRVTALDKTGRRFEKKGVITIVN